jgi:hypothetical protein
LVGELSLDGLEQVSIEDRRMLAGADLAFEVDLSGVEPIPQQMGERTSGEGNAPGIQPRHVAGLSVDRLKSNADDLKQFVDFVEPRQSRRRRSTAARNRRRPPVRCTGRLVETASDAGIRPLSANELDHLSRPLTHRHT